MKHRFASLFLLLVLFGGAFAGVPLNFGENHCSMGGMMDMDCCKAALLQKEKPKIGDEELLCALNCAQNGSTLPANGFHLTPPSPLRTTSMHPAATSPLITSSFQFFGVYSLHDPPGSPPTYLRNLALLI